MAIGQQIGDFLLSQWLWTFTFDWSHIFISMGIMFLCLRLFSSGSFLRSFLITFGSHAFAIVAFAGVVIGLLINVLHWEYTQTFEPIHFTAAKVMSANLWLAAIFLLFQTVFFFILQLFGFVKMLPYFFVSLMSNGIAAVISYAGIWMTVGYLF